jgi:hypothetical protein
VPKSTLELTVRQGAPLAICALTVPLSAANTGTDDAPIASAATVATDHMRLRFHHWLPIVAFMAPDR